MNTIQTVAYILLVPLVLGAYVIARSIAIVQQTYGTVVISNLTFSLVLVSVLLGGVSPWLTTKFWPRAPKYAWVGTTVVLVALWLLVLVAGGYKLRFL